MAEQLKENYKKENTGRFSKSRRLSFGDKMSRKITDHAGSSVAVFTIIGLAGIWLLSGPYYHYSDNWKFFINTAFTFITIILVFILQRAQNKDSQAVHLKLNEIVAALKGASNRLIDVESLSEDELKLLTKHYRGFSNIAHKEDDPTKAHSIEEAREQIQSDLLDIEKKIGL